MIRVQKDDFNVAEEYRQIATNPAAGAVVFFVGLVRDLNDDQQVTALELEHYPGMTESELGRIVDEAGERWQLEDVRVIHRVGKLMINEQIVFVAVSSRHRQQAFDAAQFIMDYLKTQAPFWKREHRHDGPRWLDARQSDHQARERWLRE